MYTIPRKASEDWRRLSAHSINVSCSIYQCLILQKLLTTRERGLLIQPHFHIFSTETGLERELANAVPFFNRSFVFSILPKAFEDLGTPFSHKPYLIVCRPLRFSFDQRSAIGVRLCSLRLTSAMLTSALARRRRS